MYGVIGGMGMMAGMWLVWIVPLLVIVFASRANAQSRREADTPLELLKKKYARGQITRDEYLQAKEDLT